VGVSIGIPAHEKRADRHCVEVPAGQTPEESAPGEEVSPGAALIIPWPPRRRKPVPAQSKARPAHTRGLPAGLGTGCRGAGDHTARARPRKHLGALQALGDARRRVDC
jgi:hypothetical protein